MNINLTPEMVSDFWLHMLLKHGLKIKPKSKSILCKIIRPFTGMSKEQWAKVSITIGRNLYIDFVPGYKEGAPSLTSQCGLIAHECQHRVQNDKDWLFPVKYIFSKMYRAKCEVEAYLCNMVVSYYLTGRMSTVSEILNILKIYRLSPRATELAKKTLTFKRDLIKIGYTFTETAGNSAILYFKNQGEKNEES